MVGLDFILAVGFQNIIVIDSKTTDAKRIQFILLI